MDSFVPEEYKQIAMACVGGVNIFVGILSTSVTLRRVELMESHRLWFNGPNLEILHSLELKF